MNRRQKVNHPERLTSFVLLPTEVVSSTARCVSSGDAFQRDVVTEDEDATSVCVKKGAAFVLLVQVVLVSYVRVACAFSLEDDDSSVTPIVVVWRWLESLVESSPKRDNTTNNVYILYSYTPPTDFFMPHICKLTHWP